MKKIVVLFLVLFLLSGCTKLENNSETNTDSSINQTESEEDTKDEGEQKEYKIPHGELLDIKETCLDYNDDMSCNNFILVIKTKIEKKYSNKATINQNYFNIADYIRKNNVSKFSEIQYWAVADMSNGNESKVVSFTVPKTIIDGILAENIVDNQLGDYVTDLYILESLKS